jgi:FG-GAP-like repeat/PASTA domain
MLRPGKLVTHSMDRGFNGWSGQRGARGCAVLLICAGLALTLGVGALFARSARSAPSFARARSYATGRAPDSVAIGDLNGDGKPDLATANYGYRADSVSVLLNRGDGSFKAKRDYTTGGPYSHSISVAIGDLNGDGKPDLAVANWGADSVSVLLNRGDGSFQRKLDYATGGGPHSVAIGDLNGDGKPDLATANDKANSVSVLLNRGDGSFQPKLDYRTGHYPESVAIGDLNGDGKLDLATANNETYSVSVLLNRGDGSFRAKRDYATDRVPYSVAIGDLNGDGKPDLATATGDGTVSVLLSRGDGSFQARHDYATRGAPMSVSIGDLNNDGRPDLVMAMGEFRKWVSVLLNRGKGSFETELDYAANKDDTESVAIGDLNGDRKPDLAIASGDFPTVSVLLNKPGLCTVQSVKGRTLQTAKRTIARANCRVGTIRRAYSKDVTLPHPPWFVPAIKKGRVISQRPRFGAVLPGGSKVDLAISLGRKGS